MKTEEDLFHNVCEMNVDAYLDDERYGIYTYLTEQKKTAASVTWAFPAMEPCPF